MDTAPITTSEIAAAAGVTVAAVVNWSRRHPEYFIQVPGMGRSVSYASEGVALFFDRRAEQAQAEAFYFRLGAKKVRATQH